MLSVLAVTFPFFAQVLLGYVAVRRGLLPLPAIPGLNTFVLFFALPCLLFRFGADTPIARLLDPAVFGLYLVCALLMVGMTMVLTHGRGTDWNNAAFGALTAAFPNSGFMGVPLLIALLGERSAGPVIITITIDMIITTSLCIALSRLDGEAGGVRAAAGRALRGVATNPMPWAIVLGATFSALDFQLYPPLGKTVGLLADSASPVALFTIGAVLARSQMNAAEASHWSSYVPVALVKLVAHPLLLFLAGGLARQAGLPIDTFTLITLVLVASLPSASNVSLLAERFGADNGRIARIILVSTALSFLSFSGAVVLLT
ncbi:MAG: AEC family transporter [Rhodocyclaceae bacterium]|nr:AEC family transporter [Rhodocyclaceae bacterium]